MKATTHKISRVWDTTGVLEKISQHKSVNIAINATNKETPLTSELNQKIKTPHRISAYVLIIMFSGHSIHKVDTQEIELKAGEILFLQPNQIHCVVKGWKDADCYLKIAFDDTCLQSLPTAFDFISLPLPQPVILFDNDHPERLLRPLRELINMLNTDNERMSLFGPYMNLLLSEINYNYLRNNVQTINYESDLKVYLDFKQLIDQIYNTQPTVKVIAGLMGVSESVLYLAIKRTAGISPKEMLTQRTMLEARRKLYFQHASAKTVAYELGFDDVNYFYRVFKRATGYTVGQLLTEKFQRKV